MGKLLAIAGSTVVGNIFCGIAAFFAAATYFGWNSLTPASRAEIVITKGEHPLLIIIGLFLVGLMFLVPSLAVLIGASRVGLSYPTRQANSLQSGEGTASQPQGAGHIVPIVGLTFRSSEIDAYDHTPSRNYPRKLNVYFSNDGDDIHLGIAKWIKGQVGIQAGRPSRVGYRLKNHLGQWDSETTDRVVPSGRWVKMWVGLDSSVPESELKN